LRAFGTLSTFLPAFDEQRLHIAQSLGFCVGLVDSSVSQDVVLACEPDIFALMLARGRVF
jgi:hypothetical protein